MSRKQWVDADETAGWRERYLAALDAAEARAAADAASSAPWRLALGFTNSVDRILALDGHLLAALATGEGAVAGDSPRERVRTPAEFLTNLLHFVATGTGGEILIADPNVGAWIAARFRGRSQVGGTGVRGANTVAGLGFSSLLHVTSFPAEQAAYVDNSGRIAIPRPAGLVTPRAAVRPDDPLMEHFIFEFPAGLSIPLATGPVVAPQANRVIVPLDPVNLRQPIDPFYVAAVADPANPVRWALVSGFNQVADAAMCAVHIDETLAAIRRWRRKPSPPRVHLELGAMPDRAILDTVLNRLAPNVDSVGLNADELAAIRPEAPIPLAGVETAATALTELCQRLGVPRLGLHTQNYCLSLTADDPTTEQAALLYGSLVAGTFARRADFPSPADLRQTLALAAPCHANHEHESIRVGLDSWQDGITGRGDRWLVYAPTLAIPDPATTIGLGDSFTAAVLAML